MMLRSLMLGVLVAGCALNARHDELIARYGNTCGALAEREEERLGSKQASTNYVEWYIADCLIYDNNEDAAKALYSKWQNPAAVAYFSARLAVRHHDAVYGPKLLAQWADSNVIDLEPFRSKDFNGVREEPWFRDQVIKVLARRLMRESSLTAADGVRLAEQAGLHPVDLQVANADLKGSKGRLVVWEGVLLNAALDRDHAETQLKLVAYDSSSKVLRVRPWGYTLLMDKEEVFDPTPFGFVASVSGIDESLVKARAVLVLGVLGGSVGGEGSKKADEVAFYPAMGFKRTAGDSLPVVKALVARPRTPKRWTEDQTGRAVNPQHPY